MRFLIFLQPYPDVTFFIHVRRKTLYYMYNVVFPCMMMSALTLLVFCLPPDSGEKIAMGITVLLAFSVFVLAIAEKMPETSDSMPLIGKSHFNYLLDSFITDFIYYTGIYLTVVMAMTSVSVVMTVMVLNFHHRGPFHKELPPWLRWFVLDKLRKFLCMKLPYENVRHSKGSNSTMRRMSLKFTVDSLQEQLLRDMGLAQNIETYAQTGGPTCNEPKYRTRLCSTPNSFIGPGIFFENPGRHHSFSMCTCNGNGNGQSQGQNRQALQNEVIRTLQMLVSRQELEDECEDIANEWRQVAQVIDRLLFWIFFVATVAITFILLIFIPLIRHAADANNLDEWIDRMYQLSNRNHSEN